MTTSAILPQPQELRTPRLLLRRWRPDDREPFRRMNADPDIMRYFESLASPEESDAIADRLEGFAGTESIGPWAVELPGEAPFIGFVGCWPTRPELPFAPAIEVGWRIDKPYWGRGYAPEAAHAALRDAFERLSVPEIVAYTAVPNAPSRQVMEKLGMTHEPAEDFDHFRVPLGHPLRRHVLYRLQADAFRQGP
jgi:RimJ/RimL family protein N-acetyltransferase